MWVQILLVYRFGYWNKTWLKFASVYYWSIDVLIDTVSILKKKTNYFKAVQQIEHGAGIWTHGADGVEHLLEDTQKTEVIILRWMGEVTVGVSDHKSWGYPIDDGSGAGLLNESRRYCCCQKHSIESRWSREWEQPWISSWYLTISHQDHHPSTGKLCSQLAEKGV